MYYVKSSPHLDTEPTFWIMLKGKWADTNDKTIALVIPPDAANKAKLIVDGLNERIQRLGPIQKLPNR